MTALFTKKDEDDLRAIVLKVRVTEEEREKIRHAASIRQLDVSEYMRRTALGRKATVDYETEIILELRSVMAEMRALCKVVLERKIIEPEELQAQLQPMVTQAIAAMLRISR